MNHTLREVDYQYDKFDNVVRQETTIDGSQSYVNTYLYDALDRLDQASLSGQNVDYSYDAFSNLKTKSGITNMVYDQSRNRLTQAVRSNGKKLLYYYDANGNQTKATLNGQNYRLVTWNGFNKPSKVVTYTSSLGTVTSQFKYGVDRQRTSQILSSSNSSVDRTLTLYFGNMEVVYKNGITTYNLNVMGNNRVVAQVSQKSNQSIKSVLFLHTDALNNVDLITDATGTDVQRFKYTPFGEQIKLATSAEIRARQDAQLSVILEKGLVKANQELKEPYGYTGHEMMNDHRLIHMNARLYDMETARFLSADSVIPEPDLYGAYNRYIYVLNNPLKYSDPSGHFFESFIIGAIISFIASQASDPTLRLIGSVASMYLMGPASIQDFGSQFTSAFAAGFVNSGIQTGSLQGAFLGGTSALVTAGIGHGNADSSITSGLTGSQAGDAMLKALLHGIAQGTMASLRGGDFKAGLSSGFVGSVMGHYTGGLSSLSEHESAQFVITVTMGGLTSRATGGSFNDGVISSATVFLFNEMGGQNRNNKNQGARKLKEIKLLESAADGHLTLEEAKAWYKHMNGEPLQVFVDELNIGYIEGVGYFFYGEDYLVHGQGTFTNDGRIFDGKYDFELHGKWFFDDGFAGMRNLGTIIGAQYNNRGVPFEIEYFHND